MGCAGTHVVCEVHGDVLIYSAGEFTLSLTRLDQREALTPHPGISCVLAKCLRRKQRGHGSQTFTPPFLWFPSGLGYAL